MFTRRRVASLILFVGLLIRVHAQEFQNLDFESKPIYAGPDPLFGSLYAVPSWTVSLNNTPQSGVASNNYVLDATAAAIVFGSSNGAVDGNQSVLLIASSYEAPAGGSATASISQTGIVPNTANAIEFKLGSIMTLGAAVNKSLPQNYFYVTLNNQDVPLQVLTNSGSFLLLAGDVSKWAGQTAQLTIGVRVPYSPPHDIFEILYAGAIDDVAFTAGPPDLTITNSGGSIIVSWPNTGSYSLQQNNNLGASAGWTTSSYSIATNTTGTRSITIAQPAGNLFFRLANP